MYLKGLYINGFKSFSDKNYIEFNKGITAIVGPNGSGKSNILDAILWVLGEQSYKQIRAKESIDIIFSGGKNKKARSSATVSLIIDNKDRYLNIDSDEISITRFVSRNSESYYQINNNKCRLKDIYDLFLDTGIGKQAYSVIGQGKVDKIISSSAVDLRNIIDEAAGIKKAKFEKENSIKKLKTVEDEIEKIEFVEKNIEEQLDKLEKQSQKAKKYRAYTSDINTLKYITSSYLVSENKKKNDIAKITKENIEENIKSLENKIEENSKLCKINENRRCEIETELNQIFSLGKENEKYLSKLKSDEKIYEEKLGNFVTDSKIQEIKAKDISLDMVKLENELSCIKESKTENIALLTSLNEKIHKLSLLCDKRAKEIEKLKQSIAINNENFQNLEIDKIRLNTENKDLLKRINSAKQRLNSVSLELNKKNQELEKFKDKNEADKLSELEKANSLLKQELVILEKDNNENKRKYEDKLLRYTALKNSFDNMKQMNKAIQFVISSSKDDPNVLGPFISKIDIDPKYQLAASITASYAFNDIIVTDDATANKYIYKLKQNKIGSTSFLPLNRIKPRTLSYDEHKNAKYLRDLIKNLSGEKEIDKVIQYVFSNTLVVNDIENGLKIKNFSDKIVSIDGDMISSSGRITGGYISKKIDDTLIQRQKIKEYEDINRNLKLSIDTKNTKIQEIKEKVFQNSNIIESLKEKLYDYNRTISSINREIETYIFEIDENREFIEKSEKDILDNTCAIENIEQKIIQNSNDKQKNSMDLENLEKSDSHTQTLNELNIKKAVLDEKISELNTQYDKIYAEYTTKNEEFTKINDFLNNKEKNLENLTNTLDSIRQNISNILNKNTLDNNKIQSLTNENSILTKDSSNLFETKNKLNLELYDKKNILSNTYDEINKNTLLIEENTLVLEKLKDIENEIKSNINYCVIDNDNLLKLSLKKITLNEKSRSDLGDINLTSIEEYRAEKEKYDKLTNDKFDLNRSRDQILNLILEIDKDVIEKFNVAIEKIQENFKFMCFELLHKASGTIKILDSNDPINTGLSLSVKYKNKPEQSLTLLSGGEKSMLAVAFIMAIFMYKPSPFTFFDEVEAALDEANTRKLIELLKKFKSSQFILITHNKETMKGADRLYGVTMKKDIGESLIVSVDI